MPTTRGWAALGIGMAMPILWFAFGERVMLAVGVFFILAVVIGIASVRSATPSVRISRTITPTQVHAGDRAVVLVGLVATKTIHAATVVDRVYGLGTARFVAKRIDANVPIEARYEVLCHPRGVYRIGPATVAVEDALGLAESVGEARNIDRLVVFPAVDDLVGLPSGRGLDPTADATRASFSQAGGEDFYTLREYQRGDDMRRVHWPYSAKTDELMIRQLETPWQSRALVMLDVRPSVYESADAFEMAVSGAASVVTHLVKSGFDADLWAGDPDPMDASRYSAAMERLALVEPNDEIDIEAVAGRIRQKGGGGALILVTGVADRSLLTVQQLLSNQYRATLLMGASSTTSQTLIGFHRLGVATVTVDPTGEWADVWLSATRSSWTAVSAS